MARPNNPARAHTWFLEFNSLVGEYLDTEGNTAESLDELYEAIVAEHRGKPPAEAEAEPPKRATRKQKA